MKAAVVVDDWKLPVFRKALTDAGFAYEDAGSISCGTTVLTVVTNDAPRLQRVLEDAADECKRRGRPA